MFLAPEHCGEKLDHLKKKIPTKFVKIFMINESQCKFPEVIMLFYKQ